MRELTNQMKVLTQSLFYLVLLLSGIANVIVVEATGECYVLPIELVRIGSVSVELSWNSTTTPETYVVSYCELPQCNSNTQSPTLDTTSYTINGLRGLSNYSVFVITTNCSGTINGDKTNFTTLREMSLYFKIGTQKVYFASGSIFRGANVGVAYRNVLYYCVPENINDIIEWYTPDGDLIPLNGPTTSFRHTVNTNTGESTLNVGLHVTPENEGRNFTCRVNSSGFIQDHYFGLYYLIPGLLTGAGYVGERIYSSSDPPVVREFALQTGTFDFDYDMNYSIQSIATSLPNYNWQFKPSLAQPQNVDDSLQVLTNVKFDSSAICQLGTSKFQQFFFSISNKPFILKTTPTSRTNGLIFTQVSCIENNSTAFVYTIGEGVDIGVTCPLFYNAAFLDIADFIQFNYSLNRNNPRSLWVDPSKTLAMVKHDREYICEDKYGTRSSFKARVDANAPIQVFDNDSTITPTNNDTLHTVNEVTLYCLSDSVSNGVTWYSETNANSTLPRAYSPVSDSVTAQPHVSNPRSGRSDLVVRSNPSAYQEGYYYCQDSMNRVMFYSIFTQQPVAPIAQIDPNAANTQIIIGTSSMLTCSFNNTPHPSAISYWTGTVASIIHTNELLEDDSGLYTCISANVVGYSSVVISITVVPPSPQNVQLPQPNDLMDIFVTDTFQLTCQFETLSNVTSSFLIRWYHNNTINTNGMDVTSTSGNIATSTLIVNTSSLQQAGDYHCLATVGGSDSTNSTPISVNINPITLPKAISVTIIYTEPRNATVSWTPSIQFSSLTETYTLVYQRVGDSSYKTFDNLASTAFTLTGLLFNSQYTVYVNATNRFGTTQGPASSFSTQRVRLYLVREGEIVQFASGSIFRGGTHSIVRGGVFQFHCAPDSPDQVVTWYAPNGDVIPAGPLTSSLYHIRNVNTGESVLYTNNSISTDNEGSNYTCSINPSTGPAIVSTFGLYYVGQDTDATYGVRLYGPGNLIYEFVYQIGTFNVNLSSKYDIECLDPSNQLNQWEFEPSLLSESSRTNTLITQAQFNSSATCQSISCNPSVQYTVFSDKPFFLQTNQMIGQPNCRTNNHLYEFSLGTPVELYITCPLIFGARFLDVSDINVIQNEFTVDTFRRLFFNSTATLELDRNYKCVNTLGDSVSFNIRVLANEAIQLSSSDSDTPIVNGTDLVGANIPNSISCITQSIGNSANWFVNSNPNITTNEPSIPVSNDSASFPYVTNPRDGRSDLILNGTIGASNEGYYSCVTNPTIIVGIFSQTPVAPTATISPDQTMVQVVIGTFTPVLNCGHSNSPHPPPIYFWTGGITPPTATLDTNLLQESDSGVYTCTASNVVGFSTDTITINVVPPSLLQFISSQLVTIGPIFATDTFIVTCQFATNSTSSLVINWYHNGVLSTSSNTIIINGTITTSTLTITDSSIQQSGDYHCVATVGGSGQTNSTRISVIINPITLPNAISVTITYTEPRNATVSWTPTIQFSSLTETYTLVYQRVGDNSYQTINNLASTSFTLTGLLFNSQYTVYVNATNRFGTTQGPASSFSTQRVRLYFVREGGIVQFASGSIFRGGTHSIVRGGVFQFHCAPDSPDQVITWYAPNGDVIPAGPLTSSLYHIRNVNTGESVLYTNNIISANTEGSNYTCSINPSTGPAIVSTFGLYYVGQDTDATYGVRLYGPGNIIYEFVYQIGTFDVDLSLKYDIECLDPSNQLNQWGFEPSLLSESSRTNTLITQAQFNSSATCQSISCNPSVQYVVFSNKPFFLQTNQMIGQPNCRTNNHLYEFSLGTPVELYITCPLIFGARFLDVSYINVIQNEYTVDTSRRLFFNSTAIPPLDRNYKCVNTLGDSVSFNIRVLANEAIQLSSSDSETPIVNGTDLVGDNIPNSISCITQSIGNSANWFVNSNPNITTNEPSIPVSNDSASFPYVTNPRDGRSDLILNGTIGASNEGYYSCVTNPSITVGIFSQTPVVPTATISPDQTMVQVVIGTFTPVLNCGHSNSPHPPPIYSWTGGISPHTATLDTNLLLESDSGLYTCTASNVVGLSTDTLTITVVPPPPQFIMIQLVSPPSNIYISDEIILQCQFSTFQNVTSQFVINWYKDSGSVANTANITSTRIGTLATSTLTISNSQLNDAGNYSCNATVGSSQNTVSNDQKLDFDPPPTPFHEKLVITTDSPYLTQDTELQCQFSTLPRFQPMLVIEWYHNDTLLLNSTSGVQITRSEVNNNLVESNLTLNNLSFIQTGGYHCVGRIMDFLNSPQNISTQFTVNVMTPPAPILVGNTYTSHEDLILGEDFSISCQFMTLEYFLSTLEIYWFHNGTRLQNNTNTYINAYDVGTTIKNSSLTITNAQPHQSGTYECRSNIVSSLITTANISVTIAIPIPPTPSQSTTPQSTTPQSTTTSPLAFDYIPVVAGVFIALLFIVVMILIVVLILLIFCKRRNKNRNNEGLSGILLKKHRKNRLRSTNSDKILIPTPLPNFELNQNINYGHDKQSQESIEVGTTFRSSGVFQETVQTTISEATVDPLYEDFTFENYSIPVVIFPQRVLEYHLANNAEFERQYSTLRKTFIHNVTTGSHINNKPKNRFANIIPYEHSRVKLTFTGEHNSDYINACYLDGYYNRQAYIATQGPMPHTLNDFWRMIWEKDIEHLVALTKVMEAAKKKCEQYWPEKENDMLEFDMIQITLKKCERYTSYDIRIMEVTHAEYPTDVRVIIQFHYTVWPDHGVPIFSSSLISFINHTKEYHIPQKAQPPMLVHCSAGVGRTGTFIALDYFLEHLKENNKVNIYRLIAQLRENRCLMVQTKDQYIFIHDALLDIICCKDTFIADHEFQAYLDNAMIRSLESMTTPFEDQYELIMKTSRIVDERDIAEASDLANVMKNRFSNFVPFDSHRVTLIPDQDGDKDYVNASFVHSYQRHKGFIAAQGPLEHTVYDFWKMITKYRIQIIIMLSDLNEGGHEMCAKYWPEEGQEMLVQYLVVSCEKEEVFDEYIRRKLVVTTQQGGLNQSIQQIQFRKWRFDEQPDVKNLMILYHQFTHVQRAIKSKEISPILVHCDNGSTRTGTFIACVNSIQQLELERKVDIFQIVRNLRNSRPCMVPSLDLYILCFKLVASYIKSYEEKAYANFM